MKKQIVIIALLIAGLFTFASNSAQAQERRFFYGPRIVVRVAPPVVYTAPVYVEPVFVAPPQYVYFGQVSVPVIWYPEFGCYGYFYNRAFFGWHGGEHRFISGYRGFRR